MSQLFFSLETSDKDVEDLKIKSYANYHGKAREPRSALTAHKEVMTTVPKLPDIANRLKEQLGNEVFSTYLGRYS